MVKGKKLLLPLKVYTLNPAKESLKNLKDKLRLNCAKIMGEQKNTSALTSVTEFSLYFGILFQLEERSLCL